MFLTYILSGKYLSTCKNLYLANTCNKLLSLQKNGAPCVIKLSYIHTKSLKKCTLCPTMNYTIFRRHEIEFNFISMTMLGKCIVYIHKLHSWNAYCTRF